MPWNQRDAHFYCRVASARTNDEVILSDARSGLRIEAAGEYGCIELRTGVSSRGDFFEVWFRPWRKSDAGREGAGFIIASGTLNFDKTGEAVRQATNERPLLRFMDSEALQVYEFLKAKQIMLEGTTQQD